MPERSARSWRFWSDSRRYAITCIRSPMPTYTLTGAPALRPNWSRVVQTCSSVSGSARTNRPDGGSNSRGEKEERGAGVSMASGMAVISTTAGPRTRIARRSRTCYFQRS
jgi:hypothetical protein